MVRYDLSRFILKVGVVDAEVGVEPLDLIGDKFTRNKSLNFQERVGSG